MAALEIPGYYYDETKKRYFKIMPTGKYSLASINQAKREREKEEKEQQQQQQQKQQLNKKSKHIVVDPSYSLYMFQQQRSINSLLSMKTLQKYGNHSYYRHLTQQSQLTLDTVADDYPLYCTNMVLDNRSEDVYNDDDDDDSNNNRRKNWMKNEFIMADRNGYIIRYGFQCDPKLKTWKTSHEYKTFSNITSLHYVPHHYRHHSRYFAADHLPYSSDEHQGPTDIPQRDCLLGTSLGSNGDNPNILWYLKLPYKFDYDLVNENVEDGNYISPTLEELVNQPQPQILYQFERKQGSFWSSCIGNSRSSFHIIVGGDKHVFGFNNECELSFQMKCKSAVLATEFHKSDEPGLFWIGCRNGDIQLIDNRCRYEDPFYQDDPYHQPTLQYHQSSSITHLKPLNHFSSAHSILSASMDGSIHLWDLRYIKSFTNHNNKNNQHSHNNRNRNRNRNNRNYNNKINSIPLQSFRGHQNEHTRQLAFHLDPETNLFTMAGNDNKVRIWSLNDNNPIVDPIWTSPSAFQGHYIPHASILSSNSIQHPVLPIDYNNMPASNHHHHGGDVDDNTWKSNPGILICSQPQNDSPSLHWYSIPS